MVKNIDKAIMVHYMIEDVECECLKLYITKCIATAYVFMEEDWVISRLKLYDFYNNFKEELEKQRQLLLNRLNLTDFCLFANETGYIEENKKR